MYSVFQLFFTLGTNGFLTLIGIIKGTQLILVIRADNCSHVAEKYDFFINSDYFNERQVDRGFTWLFCLRSNLVCL